MQEHGSGTGSTSLRFSATTDEHIRRQPESFVPQIRKRHAHCNHPTFCIDELQITLQETGPTSSWMILTRQAVWRPWELDASQAIIILVGESKRCSKHEAICPVKNAKPQRFALGLQALGGMMLRLSDCNSHCRASCQ